MKLEPRIFKRIVGIARPSAEKSAQSHSAGDRSAPSAENCANSTATAEDLLEHLGDDIDLFDLGSVNEPESERLLQLQAVGERWPNSRAEVKGGEWSCSRLAVTLIHLACHASNAVRREPSETHAIPPGSSAFQRITQINSSLFGTTKATLIFRASIQPGRGDDEETVLVVAVRANAGLMDWVANGNFELVNVEGIIDTGAFRSPTGISSPAQLRAHGGVLHAVRKSLPATSSALGGAIAITGATRVLFAGHSAGGAVANLLFAHFVTCAPRYAFLGAQQGAAPVSLDCITFGAPPVLSRNITSELASCLAGRSPHESAFFALITEGDPVPRLDKAYAMFLGTALRRIRQPPQPSPPIPPLTVHTIGELVMFREMELERDERDIRMYAIEEEVLGATAFVNLCVHFMFQHMDLVDLASCLRLRDDAVGESSGPERPVFARSRSDRSRRRWLGS